MADEPEVTVLTPKAVTNLAAQTDRLAVAGDIYTFSQLLSKDLTVTYAMSPDPDELPQEYDREEYLAMMRESHCFYSNRLCKTSIGKVDISPGAQQADVENTVVQECISRGDGSVIRVTVSEKVTLRIENGKVKIAKIAGIVMKTNFEQD